ncbi:aspartate/tyrosine/aromatic aminotransferase [Paroceanicella profunda]|uniref:Aminotransferase n=1 Tax=Paroceanicella profunda TaxID=2579971 RepID=A0A5B8FHQ4_9RHOB|nr:amino acid aminotransferase [Paroceanicella profunda]QDL92731.1 aspartate/tyrosine/aromatic aminotransferase [Paroceanicella profunda]
MFSKLTAQAPDKIIALIAQYAADPRGDKVDMGVGVYKDAQGRTPIIRAIKTAEQRHWEAETTKTYKALIGDGVFISGMRGLVLGDVAADRVAGAQSVGGTGAIYTLLDLVRTIEPQARVWMSDPTWPNHAAIIGHLGLASRSYRYFDAETREVDFEAMRADLAGAGPGDVILLHGCCHNPTGANLTLAQWEEITDMALAQGFLPFVDFAYQGFGDGLEADAAGVRAMASRVPQMLIATSCSKNFGLYRDRIGAAMVLCETPATAALARGTMETLNRVHFSFPPDHGAALVASVLSDPALRADWVAELEGMRLRMLSLRTGLADALRREANDDRFDFIARHRGMFSRLGASPAQVERLRAEHGIYMVGDSRMNIAGLPEDRLDHLARAFVSVGL